MSDLQAQISLTADASGVEAGVGKAKKSLSDLGGAAASAGAQAGKGLDGIGDGAERASAKVKRAEANWVNSIQRTIAAAEAGSRANAKYFETIAQQRGIDTGKHKALLAELDAVQAKQAAASGALTKGTTAMNQYGVSAKQTAAALRGVPAQLTDIAVSLQGGQAPLTVLLQQGGQLRDMFGGVVPAARAMGGALLGLINPFSLTAAATVAMYAAFEQGRKEAHEFSNALLVTNNIAGLTVDQMGSMAESIKGVAGTQKAAAAAIAEFARAGITGADAIEQFSATAVKMERVTGKSVSETAKQFAELSKEPLKALLKLNEGTNFVTESLYKQVRALEEQGRTAEAARVAMKAFNDEQNRVADGTENLGYLEAAWRAVGEAAAKTWDQVLNVGRKESLEDRLAKARDLLSQWESTLPGKRTAEQIAAVNAAGGERGLRNQIAGMEELIASQRKSAQFEGERTAKDQARRKFQEDELRFLKEEQRLQREMAKDIGAVNEQRKAGYISAEEAEKRISQIRDYYASKAPKKRSTERGDNRAATLLDVSRIQAAAAQIVGTYANTESELEALRSAGLVSESEYYAQKRKFIEDGVRIQVWALEAENARLAQEKLNTKDSLDNQRRMEENETKIAKLRDDAAAKGRVLNILETSSINARTAAVIAARQAQEEYLQTISRQFQDQVEGMGLGSQERERRAGLRQLDDRYDSQRRELEGQRALALAIAGEKGLTDEQKTQFAMRLGLLEEYQARARNAYGKYYADLVKKQQDWSTGASEAIQNYFDEANNVAKQTENVFSNAFKGMEDSLVTFITTGKLSFKDMADSIVADITRIIVKQQIMIPLMRALGLGGGTDLISTGAGLLLGGTTTKTGSIYSLSGGGSGLGLKLPGLASGGTAMAGGLYEVNERGPELLTVGNRTMLMMGNQSGTVTPNSKIASGGMTVMNNFSIQGPVNRETEMQIAARVSRSLSNARRNL